MHRQLVALVPAESARPVKAAPVVEEKIVETTVEVRKPVVPEKVEKEVRQKTSWLSGIFGGGFAAWFAGIDKDVLILIIAAIVIAGVLFAGEWIVRRVKSIRREIEA